MNYELILQELGFTRGEIKVYFSLFDLGETTVGPIAKLSNVTHAKVYPILDKLSNKGLVSHVIKKGRKHFCATHPNNLLDFIDKKTRELQDEKSKIRQLIPQLLAKQKTQEKVQYSRVYIGFKGLRALFYELFEKTKEPTKIRVLGLNELLKNPGFINFFAFYHDLRKNKNVQLMLILNSEYQKLVEEKYLAQNMYSKKDKIKYINHIYPTGVFIYKDHVVTVVSEDEITAFDIKSEQNARRYKNYFDSIWKA